MVMIDIGIVEKLFMNIIENTDWEVLTPSGWKDFKSIKKATVPVHSKVILLNDQEILCSPTHKIKLDNGKFVNAMDILVGEFIYPNKQVISNELLYNELEVYDLNGVEGEEYFTDGFISHNCAFIDGATEIWTAAQATLSTGGKAAIISTPNGVGNFFHKTWQEAESGANKFKPIKLDWTVHPDRDQAWRNRQTELLGEAEAAQEHDASFIFSGNTVIKPEIIEFYKKTFMEEPIAKQGFDTNLWIWEYPHPDRTYIAAADVSRGDGDDYSTIHIIDAEKSIQVAEYKGKLPTKEFGDLMVQVATLYNDALLIPDNSSIGWNSIQRVIDRGYKNLFYMSNDLHYVDVENQITNRSILSEKNMKPGFTISSRTRPLLIARLEEYMREQSIVIKSNRTLSELETFIWKHGRAEALSGYNDDLVMALGIGLWVRDTALRLRQQGIELTRLALDRINYNTTPFVVRNSIKENPYEMEIGGNVEDIRWLLG
jgi:hypothetical protein